MKPRQLTNGAKIATVSPCNGRAGDPEIKWKYDLGVLRLQELGLEVVAAPNAMRGSDYLSKNPEARAEDIMWAFENNDISAIIANIGGNDSIKIIPYIDPKIISNHPKIFIGYSDVMNIHLLCYQCGLSSFYGDNLLTQLLISPGGMNTAKNGLLKHCLICHRSAKLSPHPIGLLSHLIIFIRKRKGHIIQTMGIKSFKAKVLQQED